MPNAMQKLNYRMFGNGHPVLFLHGFLESITMWDYLNLDALNRTIILVDLPGHGSSAVLDGEPSVLAMSQEVSKLVKELGLKNVDVVGHSMGGYVGLELLNQGEVRSLTLLNSNFWEDNEAKKRDRIRVAELVLTHKNHFIQEAIPGLFSQREKFEAQINALIEEAKSLNPVGIAYAALAMRSRTDWSDSIADFADKITIVQGEIDNIVPVQQMKDKLPVNANFYLLEDAGHMAHIEATQQVQKILEEITKKNGN